MAVARVGVSLAAAVALAACGPGIPSSSTPNPIVPPPAAGALRGMLAKEVVNGGLWFTEPTCATFNTPGHVAADQRDAFATCLATLRWKPSSRKSQMRDVVVLDTASGFELQARLVGGQLTWIGFAARGETDPEATITPAVLETLRVGGDRMATLTPEVGARFVGEGSRVPDAWLKICIDQQGESIIRRLGGSSVDAAKEFIAIATPWKFRPFTIGEQPMAACANVHLTYPAGATIVDALPQPMPPMLGRDGKPIPFVDVRELKRIAGTKLVTPDDETRVKIKNGRLEAQFQYCVDEAGSVSAVRPLISSGFPSYDLRIARAIAAWKYQPLPAAACTYITFIYSQR